MLHPDVLTAGIAWILDPDCAYSSSTTALVLRTRLAVFFSFLLFLGVS